MSAEGCTREVTDKLVRLANFERLCRERKLGARDLEQMFGTRYSFWHDLLAGQKSFGEKLARRIEAKLDSPDRWLDSPQSSSGISLFRDLDPYESQLVTLFRQMDPAKRLTWLASLQPDDPSPPVRKVPGPPSSAGKTPKGPERSIGREEFDKRVPPKKGPPKKKRGSQ